MNKLAFWNNTETEFALGNLNVQEFNVHTLKILGQRQQVICIDGCLICEARNKLEKTEENMVAYMKLKPIKYLRFLVHSGGEYQYMDLLAKQYDKFLELLCEKKNPTKFMYSITKTQVDSYNVYTIRRRFKIPKGSRFDTDLQLSELNKLTREEIMLKFRESSESLLVDNKLIL